MTTLEPIATSRYRMTNAGFTVLSDTITKLNKRAKKLAMSPLSLEIIETETETLESGLVRVFYTVEISGVVPTVAGWRFVAVLNHTEEGNIIRFVPPYDAGSIDPKFRTCSQWCDHCQTNRRRNDTYVLRSETTGEEKQVGRNCLQDFLPGVNPYKIAEYAELIMAASAAAEANKNFEPTAGSQGFSYHAFYAVNRVVALAHLIMSENNMNYVSRKVAEDTGMVATVALVRNNMIHGQYIWNGRRSPTGVYARYTEYGCQAIVRHARW